MDLTKYTVVTSDDFGKFEDRVNQLLGDGWKLQGGVATSARPDTAARMLHVQWSQALVFPGGQVGRATAEEFEEPVPADLETFLPPSQGRELSGGS